MQKDGRYSEEQEYDVPAPLLYDAYGRCLRKKKSQQKQPVAKFLRKSSARWLNVMFTGTVAFFALGQVVVGCKQWQAMQNSLLLTRDTFQLGQRAWLLPEGTGQHLAPNSPIPLTITLRFKNVGNSPAHSTSVTSNWIMADISLPISEAIKLHPVSLALGDHSVRGPGQEILQSARFDDAWVALYGGRINGADQTLYLYGLVKYVDVFGVARETGYCFLARERDRDGSLRFHFCPSPYNWAT